jgi:hypothetical protein
MADCMGAGGSVRGARPLIRQPGLESVHLFVARIARGAPGGHRHPWVHGCNLGARMLFRRIRMGSTGIPQKVVVGPLEKRFRLATFASS